MQGEDDIALPVPEQMRVRIFTLAEHAMAAADGRLYISGAGVTNLNMANIPGPITFGLFLVVRLYVPYHDATLPHRVRLRVLDEDARPVGQDPLFDVGNIETGRAPGIRPGDESAINLVLALNGFPVQREGRARVYLEVDGQPLDSLPFRISMTRPTGPPEQG